MAKRQYKCAVSGRVCPFNDDFFEMADSGQAYDSCPIQSYENSNYTKEDGTRVINDWCKHLVERKEANKSKEKPMTNFERIKEMSVEELADFLMDLNESQGCCGFPSSMTKNCNHNCENCIPNWLNSENKS